MPLELAPGLPPAIPPFRTDLEGAWTIIGQKDQYLVQLQAEMLRRAEEANSLDDDNKRMQELLLRYEGELTGARQRMADLEIALAATRNQRGKKKPDGSI